LSEENSEKIVCENIIITCVRVKLDLFLRNVVLFENSGFLLLLNSHVTQKLNLFPNTVWKM